MALARVFLSLRRFSSVASAEKSTLMLPFDSSLAQHRDCVKVASQHVNWTYGEVDRYSNAFGLGLAEMGIAAGDKLAFWIARSDSAETIALQLACARIGAQIVSVTHEEQLPAALGTCKGLLFSPWAPALVKGVKRVDKVIELVPETRKTHWGSPLVSAAFPQLKHVIHLGFSTIRGMIKLKNIPIYTPHSSLSIPSSDGFFASPATTVTYADMHKASEALASELKLEKGQIVMNAIHPKHGVSLLGTMTVMVSGAKVVLPGNDKKFGRLAKSQQPKAILLDRVGDFSSCPEVDTLVIAESSANVSSIAAHLRDVNGVKASRILGLNPQTLAKL